MKPPSISQPSTIFCHSFPTWFRWCCITMLAASIGLLCVSLLAYSYRAIFAASLVPSLLVALSVAVFLNFYSLWHLRRENQVADQAFRDTDREFSSIFQNVLDGILIVDGARTCLDANPAPPTFLQFSSNHLTRQNLALLISHTFPFLK